MPYSADSPDLPENVKKLPKKEREKWAATWNSVYSSCQADGGEDCEAQAFKIANGTIETNRLHFAVNQIGKAYHKVYGGRDHLEAPVTAIIEGVLNGRFVSAAVIEASTYLWQGTPVPLGHPQENGQYISANTPELTAISPARFWDPYFEDGALKGKIVIDVERAREMGGDAWEMVERIERGELTECSTGYFADETMTPGIWQGKRYQSVVTAIYPDHLAVLLHETGACSLADGCGVLANQQEGGMPVIQINQNKAIVNLELGLTDQEQRVYQAWYKLKYPEYGIDVPIESAMEGHIIKVYADRVDVCRLDGLWAYPYTIDDDGNIAFGEPMQYQLVTNTSFIKSFIGPLVQALRPHKEVSMKEQLIKSLLTNARCKFTKEQLEAMDEPSLKVLQEMAEAPEVPPAPAPPAPTPSPAPASSEIPSHTPANEPPVWLKPLTDKIEAQGKKIDELTGQLAANAAKARQPVIDFIVTNSDLFTPEELAAKPTDELGRIKQLVAAANHYPIDYSGRGLPTVNMAGDQIAQPPSLIEAIQKPAN